MFIIGATAPISKFSVPLLDFVIIQSLEWGFLGWYIYIYSYYFILLKIKRPCRVKLFCYIYSDINDLVMKIFPFIHFCFNFHLEITWPRRVLYLLHRWKRRQLIKPMLFGMYLEITSFWKYFSSMFITEGGVTTS